MTIAEFEAAEARELDGALLALWWDGKGDWEKAHEIAQDVAGVDGAWVHAYLHRKEGDVGNATYWYRVAGRGVATGDFRREWEGIVGELLALR
jgi:hypothetical protein